MKAFLARILRLAVTLVVVAVASGVGWNVWHDYMSTPWTRDGHVRADVIGITPDVSGPVGAVLVKDNQTVAKGEILIEVDQKRFKLALDLASAALDDKQAAMSQAERDAERYLKLGKGVAVSQQTIEQAQLASFQAKAAYQEAVTNRDVAQLNLDRSTVRAPSNGVVTNLALNPGDYVSAGKAVMALVDTETLRVEGYFEENQLTRIAIGDPVEIDLMGGNGKLTGHVESIAAGIEDRERSDGTNLLADVTPTFSWVRLAQRIPVRVALDTVPEGTRLVAGLSATVTVRPKGDADGREPAVAAAAQ